MLQKGCYEMYAKRKTEALRIDVIFCILEKHEALESSLPSPTTTIASTSRARGNWNIEI